MEIIYYNNVIYYFHFRNIMRMIVKLIGVIIYKVQWQ